MGAEFFEEYSRNVEPLRKAFRVAYEQAEYDYGHSGYTGTIAEADGYEEIGSCLDLPEEIEKWTKKIEEEAKKWGPALCVKLLHPETKAHVGWYMAGWASS